MSLLGVDSTENLPHTHTLLGTDSTHTYTQTYTLTRTHTLLVLLIAISWAVNKAETLHRRAAKEGVCSIAMEPRPVMRWKDLPPVPLAACTLALSITVTDTMTNTNLWKKRFIWFAAPEGLGSVMTGRHHKVAGMVAAAECRRGVKF